ncbi:aminopeptidase P family protein [Candidatus Aerophobetes bacterium]|nr:aminopeptidase P family protein [Candidatus Aerophobetes bacterium]
MQSEQELRWKKLEQKLKEKDLDAFLVTGKMDIFYFSGLCSGGTVLFTSKKKFFFLPPMYAEEITKDESGWEVLVYENSLESELENVSRKINVKRCGFDSNQLSFALYKKIKEKFKAELVPCDGMAEKIRAIKDGKELNLIRKARQITIDAFYHLKKILHNGMSEKEVANEAINYILREADDVSFYPIVLFGKRTSRPHGKATEQKLRDNELVLIDMGAKIGGYCADITRTFMWGKVQEKWEKIYNFVHTLQQLAIQHIKPGVKASKIDELIREETAKAGYQKKLLHGAGHGIGLEVHEQPILKRNFDTVLEEGMVVCVEPGIYFAGEGGVRIEDMVLVTNQGGHILL